MWIETNTEKNPVAALCMHLEVVNWFPPRECLLIEEWSGYIDCKGFALTRNPNVSVAANFIYEAAFLLVVQAEGIDFDLKLCKDFVGFDIVNCDAISITIKSRLWLLKAWPTALASPPLLTHTGQQNISCKDRCQYFFLKFQLPIKNGS